jgi:hypothetical protein
MSEGGGIRPPAPLGSRCVGGGGGYKNVVAETGGSQFFGYRLFVNLGPPHFEVNATPYRNQTNFILLGMHH